MHIVLHCVYIGILCCVVWCVFIQVSCILDEVKSGGASAISSLETQLKNTGVVRLASSFEPYFVFCSHVALTLYAHTSHILTVPMHTYLKCIGGWPYTER